MMRAVDSNLRLEDWTGRRIEVFIDRPLGSRHPREPDLVYELNYGYVPGTLAPDGQPLEHVRRRHLGAKRQHVGAIEAGGLDNPIGPTVMA